MTQSRTEALLRHLASRPGHDEVKADIRQLLVEEFGAALEELDFEARVPEVRGRIDALIGRTVFEVKSNLAREERDVLRRLPDYLADREREEGERFIGVATDGLEWVAYELRHGELAEIGRKALDPEAAPQFLAWLDSVLALKRSLPPDVLTIRAELGPDSPAYRRAEEELRALWAELKDDPAVDLKRQLWASLLKLVYGRDIESDDLWLQHTYLVIVAKAIAGAVLGVRDDSPADVLSGASFTARNVHGAVESDFFDWVLADARGERLVRRILNHVRRFRLREVEADVLKILYESLIDRAERHGLGEYYTPDWLAAKMVRKVVTDPVAQKVLDPACGSGTFLFHAVRRFIADAEDAGMRDESIAQEACAHVAGLDIHPVAVIIARVTYLLALAPVLSRRAGGISIPVYLGDSMQLSVPVADLVTRRHLVIDVPPPAAGTARRGQDMLSFPDTFCRDPALFDKAIAHMREASMKELTRQQVEAALVRIVEQHYKRDINEEEELAIADMGETYETLLALTREGRDTIWTYVARNLSRPLAFSSGEGWANVLVGNPPWLAFRHMSKDLQERFKALAKGEGLYVGGKLATQNDLSALFVVRSAALYLRAGGRLAFVMPLAALTRGQFAPFRRGSFTSVRIQFEQAWTMDSCLQPMFPVPACVVFGRKRATARAIPDTVRAYCGSLPMRDAPEEIADARLTVTENAPKPAEVEYEGGSDYRDRFFNGATLYPRKLVLVERAATNGILGSDASMPRVRSWISSQEKEPWKSLPPIEANVEAEFLKPVLLGESILPWRVFRPFEGVIPVDPEDLALLDAQKAADRGYMGLHDWMRQAEQLWEMHKSESTEVDFLGQLNYYEKLAVQFPIAPVRVVYAKAGMTPAACVVRDEKAVIDHMLYWHAPAHGEKEALYLVAILNSQTVHDRIAHLQARGLWGARHFDKLFFTLDIPLFDPENELHRRIAAKGAEAEELGARVDIPEGTGFQKARQIVREALRENGIAQHIDALVDQLLA